MGVTLTAAVITCPPRQISTGRPDIDVRPARSRSSRRNDVVVYRHLTYRKRMVIHADTGINANPTRWRNIFRAPRPRPLRKRAELRESVC